MMSRYLHQQRTWIGLAISLVAMAFAARGTDLSRVAAAMQRADYRWLLPAAAVIVAGQLVRTWRWRLLFLPPGRPTPVTLFHILNVGYLVSSLLPLRLGDPVRAYLVEAQTDRDAGAALSTITLERVSDMLAVVVLVAALASRGGVPDFMGGAARLFGLAGLAAIVLLVGLSGQAARAERLLARSISCLSRYLPGRQAGLPGRLSAEAWGRRGYSFLRSFAALLHPPSGLGVAALSVGVWLVGALHFNLVMRGFDLRLPLSAGLLAILAAALAAALPSSPGYIGVYHAAVVEALAAFGVARSLALSYAIVVHALNLVILVGLGLMSLWLRHLSLDRAWGMAGTANPLGAVAQSQGLEVQALSDRQ
jgi:hypothetical protein